MNHYFKIILLLLVLVLNINFVYAQNNELDKYAKIKLPIHNYNELTDLLYLGISFEGFKGKFGNEVEIIVNYNELEQIRNLGKAVEIVIPDMAEYYKSRLAPSESEMQISCDIQQKDNVLGYTLGSMGGANTYSQHVTIGNDLRTNYPNIVSDLIQIGTSHNGNAIYAQRFSDNPDIHEPDEAVVYFDALIHAREPISGEVLLYYKYWLAENYGTDPEATYLIDNRQIYFVTVLNPDGYLYNESTDPNGGGLWRKNRRNNGGSYGVDLNRNYSYQWGYDNTGSSPTPSSSTYRGPSPFSEPESQAARDFINLIQPPIGFNCHTAAGVFINPYGYNGAPTAFEYYSEFAGDFAHYMNYPYGTVSEVLWYPSNGTARDWMHHDALCYTWVPEIGEDFWPSQSQYIPLVSQFLSVLKYLSWVSGNYADYQKHYIVEGKAIPGDTISLVIDVKNKGLSLDVAPVEISVTSLNNLATGVVTSAIIDTIKSWQIRNNGLNPIKFEVDPSASVMDELQFRIDIKQDTYTTSSDTISIFVGEQNVLFFDRAEDGLFFWTSSGSNGQWDTSFVSYFSKWHSFADSRYGSYANNAGNYCTFNSTINLGGTENPKLEYSAKWALESDYDYARVEISNNGGASWTALVGKYTVYVNGQQGYTNIGEGWKQESINLSSYVGQQVKFRFRLSSDGGLRTDGFYFDDFRVVDYQTPIVNSLEENDIIASKFEVSQNYPNPFNPETKIFYNLPQKAAVKIYVTNVLGEKITSLIESYQDAGKQIISWNGKNINGKNVVSGLYFIYFDVRTDDNHYKSVKKCILLR